MAQNVLDLLMIEIKIKFNKANWRDLNVFGLYMYMSEQKNFIICYKAYIFQLIILR